MERARRRRKRGKEIRKIEWEKEAGFPKREEYTPKK
jgi:hypothetical protein